MDVKKKKIKTDKKNKGGRPVVYTVEKLKEIERKIIEYTDNTDVPKIAEFSYLNNIMREELYKHPQLNYSLKRLLAKKETALEELGLEKNNTMAIFSLKQLGWRDNQDVSITISDKEISKRIEERLGLK